MCIYSLVTTIISSLKQPNSVTNISSPQPRLHLCYPRMAGWDPCLLPSYHGHTNVGVLNWSLKNTHNMVTPELLLEQETPGKLGGWQPVTTSAVPARSLTNWEPTPKQGTKQTVLFIHFQKTDTSTTFHHFLLRKHMIIKHTANKLFQACGKKYQENETTIWL